jgi:hypothetical protein
MMLDILAASRTSSSSPALPGGLFLAFGRPAIETPPALSLCALVGCLTLACGFFPDWLFQIPVGRNPEKEIHDALNASQGELAESRWTAFGRTDLVRYRSRPEVMDLYVDGTAGSPMFRFGGRRENLERLVETELAGSRRFHSIP